HGEQLRGAASRGLTRDLHARRHGAGDDLAVDGRPQGDRLRDATRGAVEQARALPGAGKLGSGAIASCLGGLQVALRGSVGLEQLAIAPRSEEHTSELQSPYDLVCRLLLEKKKKK